MRWARIALTAVQAPALCVGQIQFAFGARDPDVTETPLFLAPPRLLDRHLVREQAFLHAADEHQRKLESFRRVQRLQLHAVLPLAGLALAGLQRGMGEKGGERIELAVLFALELPRGVHQFFQVLDARLAGLTLLLAIVLEQAAVMVHVFVLFAKFELGGLGGEPLDELYEYTQRRRRARGQDGRANQRRARIEQRQLSRPRLLAHGRHRTLADAARRRVHHTLERGIVVAIGDEPEIRERVLDLRAFEEAQPAVDAKGHADREQRLFEHARLRVRAIQYRRLAASMPGLGPTLDALDDEACLDEFVEGRVHQYRFALLTARPQLLAETAAIVGDQRIRRGEDGARRAVVFLEPQDARAREIHAVALYVLDERAAPAVDRLIVVADREQIRALAREQPQPGVLQTVGVLELVHQDMLKALAIMGENVGAVAQQFMRAQQQLGEVDQPRAAAVLCVSLIDAQHLRREEVAACVDVLRPQAFFFAAIDVPLYLARRPLRLVELEALQEPADQAILIVGVEDLKGLRQIGLAPVRAQQAMGEIVKRADPHAADRDTEQLLDAAAHLGRGLVGEGHGEHAVGRGTFDPDQPGDAVHEHARLAAARARDHQHRAGRGSHCVALGVVEGIEQVGDIHRGILTDASAGLGDYSLVSCPPDLSGLHAGGLSEPALRYSRAFSGGSRWRRYYVNERNEHTVRVGTGERRCDVIAHPTIIKRPVHVAYKAHSIRRRRDAARLAPRRCRGLVGKHEVWQPAC